MSTVEIITAKQAHDEGLKCKCVATHSPKPNELHIHHILPLADGGEDVPENREPLCPTGHLANVHELYRAFKRYEGAVPWEIRRRFSPFTRALAAEGYRRFVAKEAA